MPKPSFIVIGAQKSGTTWLYANLRRHPDVYMPDEQDKELYFFSYKYRRGWDWYLSFFDKAGDAKAIGEATPDYTTGANTGQIARRMAKHLPDVRLLYIVRDPVERLPSAYVQYLANGKRLPGFAESVRQFSPLLDTSRYWARISDYRTHYPDHQIHCLFLEDVHLDPIGQLTACFSFLGLKPLVQPEKVHEPVNLRSELSVDRWFFPSGIRRYPLYDRFRSRVPRSLVTVFHALYRKRLTADVTWDSETRAWAADQLRNDSARFLEYCGKRTDFWSL
jgi:hypothetical protein